MTGILNLLAGAVSSAIKDTYFNLTTLLLPGDGTNGAQNNTFLDSSTNNFTITRNGNTTQGTFTPFSQTGWGNYFDGTDDYLSVADNAVLRPGAGAFTLEAWIYRNASGAAHTIYAKGGASTGIVFQVASTNVLRFTHTTTNIDSTGTIASNSWVHVAVVREGTGTNQTKLYINGTQDGQGTVSTDFTQTEEVRIGTNRGATDDFNGYISNLRFVKGTALYTGTFTPSTSPLTTTSQGATASEVELLTCQSNRFLDTSDNAFTITVNGTPSVQAFSPFLPTAEYTTTAVGGSGYFDGSGDYLTVADNAALDVSSGDFTVECWFYASSGVSAEQVIVSRNNGNILTGSDIQYNLFFSSGSAKVRPYSGGTDYTINVGTVVVNSWNHIALVRTGNTFYGYLNGARSATTQTISGSLNTGTWSTYIGNALFSGGGNSFFTGYCSGVRVTKGGALYTGSTYTVPTSPFTTTVSAGTANLLLNYTNAGITDATAKNDLETVGNAQISTTQSKFGGSSMYFDGTGDYLVAPNSQNFALGSGDFTVEAWLYVAASKLQAIMDTRLVNSNTTGIALAIDASNFPYVYVNNATLFTSSTAITLNTWTHLAMVRSSGTITLYINGTKPSTGSAANTTNLTDTALTVGSVIDYRDTTATLHFNGYIDDLRITKGFARYTANFTAPTAAFPLQ